MILRPQPPDIVFRWVEAQIGRKPITHCKIISYDASLTKARSGGLERWQERESSEESPRGAIEKPEGDLPAPQTAEDAAERGGEGREVADSTLLERRQRAEYVPPRALSVSPKTGRV